MKLHRIAVTYPTMYEVVTWCGLWVTPDCLVKPEDVGTERECQNCQKRHDNAVERGVENLSVKHPR